MFRRLLRLPRGGRHTAVWTAAPGRSGRGACSRRLVGILSALLGICAIRRAPPPSPRGMNTSLATFDFFQESW